MLCDVFLDQLSKEEESALDSVIDQSFFLVNGQESFWKKSISLFFKGHYFSCLMLILPLLEHGLRKIFLFENRCPKKRGVKINVLAADSVNEGFRNKFKEKLPQTLLNAVYDLFVYKESGGGIRHTLAHGVTESALIPREYADRCIVICLGLAMYFSPRNFPGNFPQGFNCRKMYHC